MWPVQILYKISLFCTQEVGKRPPWKSHSQCAYNRKKSKLNHANIKFRHKMPIKHNLPIRLSECIIGIAAKSILKF